METDSYKKIKKLVEKKLNDEALNEINQLEDRVKIKPSYQGYYWLSHSYNCLDREKYARTILENIESASEFDKQLPNKELPHTILLLKAQAYFYLKQFDNAISVCDKILQKQENCDAYLIRAKSKDKIDNTDANIWTDIKRAADLGNNDAKVFLIRINNKK
jgi:hypothetical protein